VSRLCHRFPPLRCCAAPSSAILGGMTTSSPPAVFDPASISASSWGSRLAGLRSHRVPNGDPRIAQCEAGLFYWQTRRPIDKRVAGGLMSQGLADSALDKVREMAEAKLREMYTDESETAGPAVRGPAAAGCENAAAVVS